MLHGVIDYITGIVLFMAPSIFGFAGSGGAIENLPRIVGVLIILQAVCTDYELGVFKALSMRAHLVNDYIAGALLAVSPWLFGFSAAPREQWMPHVAAGIAVLVVALVSQPYASYRGRPASGTAYR